MSFVTVIVLTAVLSITRANVHSWGRIIEYHYYHLLEKTLIDEQNSVPKDYTIYYKYHAAQYKPVSYIEINVNTNSDGFLRMKEETYNSSYGTIRTTKVFQGRINIKNATNVQAHLKILGVGYLPPRNTGISRFTATKSAAFVYVKKSNQMPMSVAQNSIGKRVAGDTLIHFESRNVKNRSRFPSSAFEYSSSVAYITYVGFSFDSLTAMVLINTTFIGDQEFSAVVYDVNSEQFVANCSVYGIISPIRPYMFQGLI